MSNRETRSQTVKDEVKTDILDHVIKKELKSELEDVTGKSQGFICPTCKAHFLYYTISSLLHILKGLQTFFTTLRYSTV